MNDQEKPQVHATGAARSAETARSLIRKAKRATRRRFSSEDKIRILMEGIRGELAVAELCRREGIHATVYYKWLKDCSKLDQVPGQKLPFISECPSADGQA